jgi:hypothetical protein
MDVNIQNEGSIVLFHLKSDAAKAWVAENIPSDVMYFGDAIVVEHRFADNVANGMLADGLGVE